MKQNTPRFLATLLLGAMLALAACNRQQPMSKQDYLQQFQSLVDYTHHHCGNLSDSESHTADAIFELFSQEWYDVFYDELSPEERLSVWKYRMQYLECKARRKARDKGKSLYQEIENRLLD